GSAVSHHPNSVTRFRTAPIETLGDRLCRPAVPGGMLDAVKIVHRAVGIGDDVSVAVAAGQPGRRLAPAGNAVEQAPVCLELGIFGAPQAPMMTHSEGRQETLAVDVQLSSGRIVLLHFNLNGVVPYFWGNCKRTLGSTCRP